MTKSLTLACTALALGLGVFVIPAAYAADSGDAMSKGDAMMHKDGMMKHKKHKDGMMKGGAMMKKDAAPAQ